MGDDPFEIAIEQFLYWRQAGLTPREMLDAVGHSPPLGRKITSEYVVDVLTAVHQSLRHHRRAAA